MWYNISVIYRLKWIIMFTYNKGAKYEKNRT